MSKFLRSPLTKVICYYLTLVMGGLIPGPMEARASFISHQPEETTKLDLKSLETLRKGLENKLITEKLSELGLTEKEIIQRIEQLSPEEREIVLEKLDTIQSGGFIGALAVLIFPLMLLIFTIMEASENRGPLRSRSGVKKSKRDKKSEKAKKNRPGVTFIKATDSNFPPYEGKVKVLIEEEPNELFTLIGKVNIHTFTAISKEKRNRMFLRWMKEESAEYGADTIILETSEPKREEYPYKLFWSAQSYKTLGEGTVE